MATVYVVRHAQTTHNAAGIVQGPRIDSELSDEGRRQAERLAEALGDVDALVASPMVRARQTAQALIDRSQGRLAVQVAPELYEVDYGELSGQTFSDAAPVLEQVLDAWAMGFPDKSFPGGESAVVAQHRIRPLVERLRMLEGTVAVVAHGRINRVLVATLAGTGLASLASYPQDNAAITEVRLEGGRCEVVRINDTSHLDSPTTTPG